MSNFEEERRVSAERLQNLRRKLIWLAFTGVLFVALAAGWYFLKFNQGFSSQQEVWGTFGDYFGGLLNPVLSFLALIALLYTIVIQMEELNHSREELAKSSHAMGKQANTSAEQLLESTFFHMLRLHNAIVQDFKMGSHEGRKCGNVLLTRFANKWDNVALSIKNKDELATLILVYDEFYQQDGNMLGHYFRNLFQIVKFVDESGIKNQKRHIDLLRAQLSRSEQLLLFLNVVAGPGREKFKPLVEKFSLLEHLDPQSLPVSYPTKFVDPKAFG